MARLSPGDPAPDFTLPDADGNDVSLADLRGQRVIVYFYPAAMTPGVHHPGVRLPRQPGLAGRRRVTRCSASPRTSRPSWRSSASATPCTFPLLSDESKATLEAYGAYGEKTMYGKTVTGVIRSTFVIDADGRIELAQYNVKATGHVAKLRRDLGLDRLSRRDDLAAARVAAAERVEQLRARARRHHRQRVVDHRRRRARSRGRHDRFRAGAGAVAARSRAARLAALDAALRATTTAPSGAWCAGNPSGPSGSRRCRRPIAASCAPARADLASGDGAAS